MNETEWHSGLISENNLVSLDVSGWDTSNVRKMPWLFRGCSFSSIDLSSWDTGKVEDMTAMFWGCKNLVRADVSRWNTSNVAEMKELFRYCCRLVSVDLTGWDISNVRSSFDFFLGDTALNYDPWTEHPGKTPITSGIGADLPLLTMRTIPVWDSWICMGMQLSPADTTPLLMKVIGRTATC
ncbi:MAG: BspA family leucine-rich repeat surface protein [Clostridia bacterium]|nr:BspA family leucine-rich repeat surface protein [Clostridia bacterium]